MTAVTGALSGLGRAISLRYACKDVSIIRSDLRPDAANDSDGASTHEAIVQDRGQAVFVKTNLGESADMERLVAATVGQFGRMDV